ncbi:MAG: hypothetical protein LQ348_002799 [Seirophora lacunosa]|nr:MAG: hypothetical protein LQ348_002799 [Seirophora lacunosa]
MPSDRQEGPVVLDTLELESRPHSRQDLQPNNYQQLKPADGGIAAWKVLFAAFMFEALLWGFPISFGVFQNHYAKLPEFEDNPHVTIVGTMASGIPYLGAPFMAVFVRRYQRYRNQMIWAGWPLCIAALVAGSFANTIGALIVTQGIMYGTGFLIFYYPIISIVTEWWIQRRGMAFGIITSAAGASGIAMPLIIETLLDKYGHRTTLQAVAVSMALLTGPLIPFLKGRLPPSQSSTVVRQDWSFARRPLFHVYCTANIAQGLGFFFPSLFLPSYATSIDLSARKGALLLALMCFAQVLGQSAFGILSDKVGLNSLLIISTSVAAVATFTSWGLAHDLAPLIVFALFFGFFAYGFCSLRARMGTAVSEEPTAALATFGIFVFCQGFGNVLAGPISAALLSEEVRRDGYGLRRYKSMIIFTGTCTLMSAVSVGLWLLRPKRLLMA